MFYSPTDKLLFKCYFYHMAFKEERSIEQCIILTFLLRFPEMSQIRLEN